jgi:hypothetical protein
MQRCRGWRCWLLGLWLIPSSSPVADVQRDAEAYRKTSSLRVMAVILLLMLGIRGPLGKQRRRGRSWIRSRGKRGKKRGTV